MKRHCFALDLKNDPSLIDQYKAHHKNVWPVIEENLLQSGIINLEIYHVANRLFMIMDTHETFNLEEKSSVDKNNLKIQRLFQS